MLQFQSKMGELESQLSTEKTRRMSDAEEWKQFQADLLMTVRVANDFQTEAQHNLEAKSSETEELRERIRLVLQQIFWIVRLKASLGFK